MRYAASLPRVVRGTAPTAGGVIYPGATLRPDDKISMVTEKKLVDLGRAGAAPVALDRGDTKAAVAAKALKSIWNDAKGDALR